MNKQTVGMTCLVLGLAMVVSTGAVPGTTDEIHDNVHVYPHPEPSGSYAYIDDSGDLAIDVASETAVGVNPDTRLWADDVFVVRYTGDGSAAVRIVDNASDVEFYRGTYPEDVTSVEEKPITLNESESTSVGMYVDTEGRSAGDRVLESVSFDVTVDEQAERTSLRAGGDAEPVEGDGGSAEFAVTDVLVGEREASVGSEIEFAVTVQNSGERDGEFVIDLATQHGRLALQSVQVPAGGNVTWTYTHDFDAPGTYEVTVDGVGYGSIVVAADGEGSVTPGGVPESGETTAPVTTPETATATVAEPGTETAQVELGGVGYSGLLVVVLVTVVSMLLVGVRRLEGERP